MTSSASDVRVGLGNYSRILALLHQIGASGDVQAIHREIARRLADNRVSVDAIVAAAATTLRDADLSTERRHSLVAEVPEWLEALTSEVQHDVGRAVQMYWLDHQAELMQSPTPPSRVVRAPLIYAGLSALMLIVVGGSVSSPYGWVHKIIFEVCQALILTMFTVILWWAKPKSPRRQVLTGVLVGTGMLILAGLVMLFS